MNQAHERGTHLSRVVERRTLCREHYEIVLALPGFPPVEPGQFIQILCRESGRSNGAQAPILRPRPSHSIGSGMLRRPFSVAGLTRLENECRIEIVGRVVGPATAWMNALKPGDEVDLLGPLGRAFSIPEKGQDSVLIAGGVGLPPIRWLAEKLCKHGLKCESIVGARTRELLPVRLHEEPRADGQPTFCVEEFTKHGAPSSVTTDDGSCGLPGQVTSVLEARLRDLRGPEQLRVFACGPDAMMSAVGVICRKRGVPCELAMERVMGCGMGTCQSCVVRVREETSTLGWRYALCCTEGPVFDARVLIGLDAESDKGGPVNRRAK
ncbi:MAG: dihydroorotate dehydrogenase electron transfer subunit [Planctomycetota bacterium]|nr:dihydroorotate dehydrogenase electron transfer subunit [Planctomycetota bacterium]